VAFSDSSRKFWQVDLSSRAGARGASYQGGLACFIFCAMSVIGFFLLGGMAGYSTPEGLQVMTGAGLEFAVALVAGLRLRAGKGAYWGIAAAAFAALELVGKLVTLSLGGTLIGGLVLLYLVNGIRGAFALKNERGFADDDISVFE
jgi:hypothetical protein